MADLDELMRDAATAYLPDDVPPFGAIERRGRRRRARVRVAGLTAVVLTAGSAAGLISLSPESRNGRPRLADSDGPTGGPQQGAWTDSGSGYAMPVVGDPVVAGVAFGKRVAWVQAPKEPSTGLVGSYRTGTPGARVIHVHDFSTGKDWSLAAQTPNGTIAHIAAEGDWVVATEVVDADGCSAATMFCNTWRISAYDLSSGAVLTVYRDDTPGPSGDIGGPSVIGFPVIGDGYTAWVSGDGLHYESLQAGDAPAGQTGGPGGVAQGTFSDQLSIAGGSLYFQRSGEPSTLYSVPLPDPSASTTRHGPERSIALEAPALGPLAVTDDGVIAWATHPRNDVSQPVHLRVARVDDPGAVKTALDSMEIYGVQGGRGYVLVSAVEGLQMVDTGTDRVVVRLLNDAVSPRAKLTGKSLFFATHDDPMVDPSRVTLHVEFFD